MYMSGEKEQVASGTVNTLVFGIWDTREVKVEDPSLERYINLAPISVPHSGGKNANRRFGNINVSVVERLINNLMRTSHYTGMKNKSYNIVKKAFEIINEKTKSNPIQILVRSIENSSPREETTRLRFGGVSVLQAVDTSPIRRLNIALQNIAKGAVKSTFRNKRSAANCLADEIMNAADEKNISFAVSKKNEIERIAASAR